MEEYPNFDSKAGLLLSESVTEAQRLANIELKHQEASSKKRHTNDGEDSGEDDQEQNTDLALFTKNKKRKTNSSHSKGFNANKSFAKKRPRKHL